jgi:hypothetical protein
MDRRTEARLNEAARAADAVACRQFEHFHLLVA